MTHPEHMAHHYCMTCDRRIENPRFGGVECFQCEYERAYQTIPGIMVAFWDGWFAGLEGRSNQEMPYRAGTREARDWLRAHDMVHACFFGDGLMAKLTTNQKSFLRLVKRSSDIGEGWRQVSETLRSLTETRCAELPALLEYDAKANRVRFTEEGAVVVKWLGS